jgi:hypothetical protein
MIYKEPNDKLPMAHQQKDIEYYVDKNKCWICTSHNCDSDGYPKIRRNNKCLRLSRYIYTCEKGSISDNLVVMHTCDNPNCINPDHLVLGTVKDNNKDRDSKGRTAKNERNGGAKLTPEQIEAIRKDSRSCREIAKDYPVHFSQIARIKSGRHWRE